MSVFQLVLVRKSTTGNVANNIMKWQTGALNIDETRIGTEERTYKGFGNKPGNVDGGTGQGRLWLDKTPTTKSKRENARGDIEFTASGRWPANIVLCHTSECVRKGTKKVKGHKGYPNGPGGIWEKEYQQAHQDATGLTQTATKADNEPWVGHADADGKETIEDWDCHDECMVGSLDSQSGILISGKPAGKRHGVKSKDAAPYSMNNALGDTDLTGFGDKGGASRFFKKVQEQ